MSRTRTLAQLRSLVENQADIVGATARYSPTLVNGLINQSIQRFRERISIEGSTRYLTQTSGSLTMGAASGMPFGLVDLSNVAPGVVRTFGVDLTVDGQIVTLEHRPFEERTKFGTRPALPIAWAQYGNKVAILPPPVGSYPYTVWYLPVLADLTADSDTWDGVTGWEDFVVWDVFQRLVTRDGYEKVFQQASIVKDQIVADIVRGATKVSHAGGAHRGRDTFGAAGFLGGLGRRQVSAGGGVPSENTITNAMLADMVARTIKGNPLYDVGSPQDLSGAQVADILPSFAGFAGGLVPTGVNNPALFLSQGGWIAPTVGGSVSGLALSQLQDIPYPRVLGNFGLGTGPVQPLTGQQVASMIGVFTGSAHGLVPRPTGGVQGFVLDDSGKWVAQTGGGGGSSNLQLGGPTGAVQFNGGTGLGGATGFGFSTASGLHFAYPFSLPTGYLAFGSFPAVQAASPNEGRLLFSSNEVLARARGMSGTSSVQLIKWDGEDRLVIGESLVRTQYEQVAPTGSYNWFFGSTLGMHADLQALSLGPGRRLGVQQLAIPDSVGDKLATWTASGFANHATGIRTIASGMALSVGTGGPILHASGIDLRQGDIRNVRRINGLDGIKLYGDLPDANANITEPSGTAWIIPETVTGSHIYTIVPSGTEHGKSVLIENRSPFAHSIYQSGTGLGAPSGWIATLAPSGGMSARFASGAHEFGVKYQLGGF